MISYLLFQPARRPTSASGRKEDRSQGEGQNRSRAGNATSALAEAPLALGDQPSLPFAEHVVPRPLEEDRGAVAETDEVEDVDEEPREPRQAAGEPQLPHLGDGAAPADRGHLPLVVVRERPPRPAREVAEDRL